MMSEEMNDMNDMVEMKEQHLAPFFGKIICFPFFGIILSCLYISRGTTVVIQLYNKNHIKHTMPIFQVMYLFPEIIVYATLSISIGFWGSC